MDFFNLFNTVGQNIWIYGGSFLLVLSVLVFIHEWGHYIVARMCGVRVEIFSIGFGPELFGFDDAHGTRWKFSLVPLGGYVKMYGDADPASAGHEDSDAIPDTKRHEAFFAKPVAQRAAVVFAGPAINYVYAIIVMAFVFAFNGQSLTPPYASAVVGGSAAETAGFMPHDEIIAINGEAVRSFEDIRKSVLVGLDEKRIFTVVRDGQEVDLTAYPDKKQEEDRFGFSSSRGFLGITGAQHAVLLKTITSVDGAAVEGAEAVRAALQDKIDGEKPFWIGVGGDDRFLVSPQRAMNADFDNQDYLALSDGREDIIMQYSPLQALGHATVEVWSTTTSTLQALGQMFTGARSATELGGLIRIGALAGDIAQKGFIALIMFSALLSVNLGLLNLFPIPVLDGGHLVFYAIEAASGKPVSEKAQDIAFRFGFGFLIAVMAFANINDIVQLFL